MQKRVAHVRKILESHKSDAFLISNFHNIQYLSGFVSLSPQEREGFMLVTADSTYLLTDGRYMDQLLVADSKKNDYKLLLIEPTNTVFDHMLDLIKAHQIRKLAFEPENVTFQEYVLLTQAFPSLTLISIPGAIETLRSIKDENEIKTIKKACELTDEFLTEIVKSFSSGMFEKECVNKIESLIKKQGHGLAFDPIIVAVDKNSALPHYDVRRGHGVIQKNSVVLIDLGISYKQYVSDITRMIFFGRQSDKIIKTYKSLQSAQEKTIAELSKTQKAKEIDAFCRAELQASGLPSYPHSTGHGVGLEIHELPKLSSISPHEICNGNVFTIEPGVYYEGKWGMRVEDTVAFVDGQPQALTHFSKDPLIIL